MELTKADLHFVVSRIPRDITKLLKQNPSKLFVAGGFIRATIAGEKVSDIDMFGESKKTLLAIAKDLTLVRKGRFFETENAITVLAHPRHPVQFITRWLFTDPQKLVESFDFTICQAIIWAEETVITHDATVDEEKPTIKIVYKSLISEGFYPDLAARRLVYTSPTRKEAAGGSMMRVIKFVKRGYSIQAPSLAGVIARLANKLDFKRVPEEKWIKVVLTGLLREVDPMIIIDGVDFLDEHEIMKEEGNT